MPALKLRIHRIAGDTTPVPIQPLIDLFKTAGVDLSVHEIPGSLPSDPISPQGYQATMQRILGGTSPVLGDAGNLIIGQTWSGPGDTLANGMLVDGQRRGFAAVFTWSSDLTTGGQSALLRTAAHEIGHMLNLTHSDGDPTIPTLECQSQIQDQFLRRIDEAWAKVGIVRPPGVDAFPFGPGERSWLSHATIDEIEPWGTSFRDEDISGAQDLGGPPLEVTVIPSRDTFTIGSPLFFDVHVKNPSNKAIFLPGRIAAELGNIRFVFRDPSGSSWLHSADLNVCGGGLEKILPGERAVHPQILSSKAIQEPGRYVLQAAMPISGVRIPAVNLSARRSKLPQAVFDDSRFASSLAAGILPNNKRLLSEVDRALAASRRSTSPELFYLALLRARTTTNRDSRSELLRLAQGERSPTGVRHAAFMHEAAMLMSEPNEFRNFSRSATDALDQPGDARMRQWLKVANCHVFESK